MSWKDRLARHLFPNITAELTEVRATLNDYQLSLTSLDGWDRVANGAMSESESLMYSPIYRSCDLIGNTVGKLPFITFKVSDTGKEPAREHPAYPILKHQANPFMSSFTLRNVLTLHRLLHGNGYAWIERKAGRPVALWPLSPLNVEPIALVAGDSNQVEVFYKLTLSGHEPRLLDASDVLHIRGLGDFLQGFSVLWLAATSFKMGTKAQEYSEKFFENGARPDMAIIHPGKLKPESIKALRDQWNSYHKGVDNAHKVAVLQDAMDIKTFSINAKDAQLIETIKFSVSDVANWFGVPPHKLGDNSRAAFNTLEEENQSFLDDTIDAHLVNWETETRAKLLTETEKATESHFTRFRRQALVRANLATRGEYYVKALAGRAWLSPDEVRTLEDLNTVGGEQGEIIDPTNNFAPGDTGSEAEPDDSNGEAIRAAEEHLEAIMTRMRDRLSKASVKDRATFVLKHEHVVDDAVGAAGKVLDRLYNQSVGTTSTQCKTKLLEERGI